MRAVKSVSIDSERRVIITYLDGSTETLYPNCIWCDSEALRQLIKDLLEDKADAITQTIENVTIATFADGADEGVIKKLLVSIEPIQEGEGDPSPDNVRPISGRTGVSVRRTGKNLIPTIYDGDVTKNGITFEVKSDGVHATGTATSAIYYNVVMRNNQAPILPAGTYTLSPTGVQLNNVDIRVAELAGQSIIAIAKTSKTTFTITESKQYFCFFYIPSDTIFNDAVLTPQLELGSTATGYEPYKGSTYSVSWETEAGTVYGGSLDVVSGKLTVDRGYSKLSDLASWGSNSNLTNGIMRAVIPNVVKPGSSVVTTAIMDCRKAVAYGPLQPTWTTAFAISYEGRIVVPMNRTITEEEFLSEYGNHEVCYPLATPTEIQLTPQEVTTLLGNNNIWADSGNILELEYTADTKLYIGEQQSGTSGELGSGRQEIVNPDIQTVSEKTLEDVEAYKEATDERGEE